MNYFQKYAFAFAISLSALLICSEESTKSTILIRDMLQAIENFKDAKNSKDVKSIFNANNELTKTYMGCKEDQTCDTAITPTYERLNYAEIRIEGPSVQKISQLALLRDKALRIATLKNSDPIDAIARCSEDINKYQNAIKAAKDLESIIDAQKAQKNLDRSWTACKEHTQCIKTLEPAILNLRGVWVRFSRNGKDSSISVHPLYS